MTPKAMQRHYLREAAVTLGLSWAAVRVLPAAWILAWARRQPRRIHRFYVTAEVHWISWAIEVVGAKASMKAPCLPRALAAQAMLRRRGIASRLCLGVTREGQKLSAHAWLELGQNIVTGAEAAPRFTRLVEFGGERA